ncbi:MAG: pantoate--beta-alanine ligase [Gammaproteobacteria bacterium]|nr:pantoate--beta-alanine ligase [Gammaproteobacteria bacterium]
MRTVNHVAALRAQVAQWRDDGEQVALVPTMGNLHAGHLALVERARQIAERTVVSVFVNPFQFVPGEDYEAYPRTPDADRIKLSEAGVDVLFMPTVDELYERGFEATTRVQVPALDGILCGASRPGHFTGVATVVTKLFNIVGPDYAVFGDKDFQQLLVIRRLVEDLCIPVDVVAVATVRERDGLALSSRNVYLTTEERITAPRLYLTVKEVADRLRDGPSAAPLAELVQQARARLESNGFRADYVTIRRAADLGEPDPADTELVVLAAAWLGRARLIDHIEVTRG